MKRQRKHGRKIVFLSLIGVLSGPFGSQAQPSVTNLQLRLESRPGSLTLRVDGQQSLGALFVYQAADVVSLRTAPALLMQTNTLLASGSEISVPIPGPHPTTGFYKATHWPGRTVSEVVCGGPDLEFIAAGSFAMGDSFNDSPASEGERPVHTVEVSGFCIDRTEVSKALWDQVRAWAVGRGYLDLRVAEGKGSNYPAHTLNWYDAVKWCNARSEMEGRVPAYYIDAAQRSVYRSGELNIRNEWVKWDAGYRLPTEAEWEKAARGGVSGRRFPWGTTIQHENANYNSSAPYAYDISPTRGFHPLFATSETPYTSPGGYFPANGYGLNDIAGNVLEWCWDWWSSSYYTNSPVSDPHGPSTGSTRMMRGGSWPNSASNCRVANRSDHYNPSITYADVGFRTVLPRSQP